MLEKLKFNFIKNNTLKMQTFMFKNIVFQLQYFFWNIELKFFS